MQFGEDDALSGAVRDPADAGFPWVRRADASGVIRRGDRVMVLPSGRTSRVKSIVTFDGDLEEAYAPLSVTVCLEDEIDISRGDMLVSRRRMPHVSRRFEATMVWMARRSDAGRPAVSAEAHLAAGPGQYQSTASSRQYQRSVEESSRHSWN